MLLDCYFIADRGIHESIKRETRKGKALACAKGCSNCCRSHKTIPIYPLEVVGIYWYAIEKLNPETKPTLRQQLSDHKKHDACPFLINGICAIHPMRPLACRHFNVFGNTCEEGEDAFFTRREDVMTPIKKYQNDALSTMLPFHDIKKRPERRDAMKRGVIHTFVQVLQEIEWGKLAARL
jgi:Fe-S-cluster containining protein